MEDLDVEHFAAEIKKRRALWDFKLDDYRNKNKRKRLWREVYCSVYPDYDELSHKNKEIIGAELQLKWKCLRDSYTRYLRILKTKKGQARKNVKKHVNDRYLDFLKPVIHVRQSGALGKIKLKVQTATANDSLNDFLVKEESNLNDSHVKEESDSNDSLVKEESYLNDCNNDDNEHEDDSSDDNQNIFFIPNQDENEVNGAENGRPYIINMFNKKVKTNMEYINSINMDSCEQEECTVIHETANDDMDFFRSLLPFLKSLPLYQKISFRADIMKIAQQYANNLGKSHASPTKTLSSTSFLNSPSQQQIYLPVLPLDSLPFHNLNSNHKSSIEILTKNLSVPSSVDNPNTTSPSL